MGPVQELELDVHGAIQRDDQVAEVEQQRGRDRLTRRFFAVPESDTDWIYLFDVLTSASLPGPNTGFVTEKLARNRGIYERARALGATLYPISAVPMQPTDWAHQCGPS